MIFVMVRIHGKDEKQINAQKIFTGKPEGRRTIENEGVDWSLKGKVRSITAPESPQGE
jgi:hypothetical protein